MKQFYKIDGWHFTIKRWCEISWNPATESMKREITVRISMLRKKAVTGKKCGKDCLGLTVYHADRRLGSFHLVRDPRNFPPISLTLKAIIRSLEIQNRNCSLHLKTPNIPFTGARSHLYSGQITSFFVWKVKLISINVWKLELDDIQVLTHCDTLNFSSYVLSQPSSFLSFFFFLQYWDKSCFLCILQFLLESACDFWDLWSPLFAFIPKSYTWATVVQGHTRVVS